MKKGFTLLELIVVIIIIGVLATLGITQYAKMIERARGAEARQVLGAIRTHAAAIYMQESTCANCTNANLGIGIDYPGPAAANCTLFYYFWYNNTQINTGIDIMSTRCLGATGKQPGGVGAVAGTVRLQSNFSTGLDTWTTAGGY